MKNSTYWSNRMRILRESLLDTGYEYVQNLEAQYEMAIAEIDKKIAAWYQRFAKNNEISLAEAKRLLNSDELEEFKWTVRSYIEHGEASALSGEWLKQLENASSRVHISRLDSLKLQLRQEAEALHGSQLRATESLLGDIYREGYFHTAFELQKGLGFGWSLHGMSASTIEKVLARPWTTDGQTFRDRVWTNKAALVNSVNTNLTQMIMRGEAPDRAIKAIAKQFGVSKGKAGRLVMTESAAFASAAQKDCFTELDVEEYKIIETLDQYTCDTCGALDGKVYKMSDFQVGVTAPPFHPWCRGCTAPYFADMDDWGAERAAKDADGKTYDVPANMKYSEWAKKTIKNPGVSNENAKTPFTTAKESDIIIGKSVGAKALNYDVMDLDTGEIFHFVEGSKIQNVEVFAGKGTRVTFRKAEKFAARYGGDPKDWQHVKGFGVLATDEGDRDAEVHWVQCADIGKFEFFVKEWLD